MIVLIGASASGKTEVSKILEKQFGYKKCITTTTRDSRVNEINGIDYHFISKELFKKKLDNDEFVEHAIYNDNYYGINRADINTEALVIVEPNGANTLIDKLGKKAFIVFIESDYEIRKQRMLDRLDNLEDILNRLENDDNVFKLKNINRIDLIVKNNNKELIDVARLIANKYKELCKELY